MTRNELKSIVASHFKTLFSKTEMGGHHDCILPGGFSVIAANKLTHLAKTFSSKEVREALKSMGPLKAPGPDGFHALFFPQYWSIVGDTVCQTVLRVLNGGALPEGMNDTCITLIPKVPNLEIGT